MSIWPLHSVPSFQQNGFHQHRGKAARTQTNRCSIISISSGRIHKHTTNENRDGVKVRNFIEVLTPMPLLSMVRSRGEVKTMAKSVAVRTARSAAHWNKLTRAIVTSSSQLTNSRSEGATNQKRASSSSCSKDEVRAKR